MQINAEPQIVSDAFGQQLWDAYHDGYGGQIIERDDGLIDVGDAMHYFSSYDNWRPELQKTLDRIEGNVLVIGCGAGRHALYLQEQGCDVTGIDISPLAIRLCKERGLRQVEVKSIADLQDYADKTFDTILLLGNNLGLLGDIKSGRRILTELYRITTEDGIVIGETRDPHLSANEEDKEYHQHNKETGRMPGHVTMRVRHKKIASHWFYYFFYTKKEIGDMVTDTGWHIQRYIDHDDIGSKYITVLSK